MQVCVTSRKQLFLFDVTTVDVTQKLELDGQKLNLQTQN